MKNIIFMLILIFMIFSNHQLVQASENVLGVNLDDFIELGTEEYEKYPANSDKEFQDADTFYESESADKSVYKEFKHAKLNIREKVLWKDVNSVLARAEKEIGKMTVGGDGYNPERQVYVFVTVSHDGYSNATAVYDAELKRIISTSSE